MAVTPEFVRWTIPLACALREDTDVTNPEQTERQLRSLRTYSDCVAEGREFAGVCISGSDPSLGFPSAEVLQAYGGETLVHSQCDHCQVNLLRGRQLSGLAGCFGTLILGHERGARLDAAIEHAGQGDRFDLLFLPTRPRWYGLWTAPALTVDQQLALHDLLSLVDCAPFADWQEFRAALAIALAKPAELHLQNFPAGEASATTWSTVAHCQRCKAPMGERERHCATCGLSAHAQPRRQRKVRGGRPFVPLARFLGEPGTQALLARFAGREPR